ncbi:MAG TPA: DNA polymerase III subunit delta' [Myxococcota bacterium]|nr:DNA polymerase III subunit delta' [Myxococcota bacterium]
MFSGYSDLLGQEPTMRQLVQSASAGTLHHCVIFEGPPKVGKHTAAVRIAMAAACVGRGDLRPCGACPFCRQMAKGLHPDLIEVVPDPGRKSGTISVAQARELTRQVRLRPYSARRRTVIIDPVDMLVPQASNALLKTLEEPPEGTGFILVTARVSSLLPTVLSRSQRVRFRAAPEAELVPFLEARGVEDARRIARLSMGCPGRALELGEGGLAELDAVRTRLVELVDGSLRERHAQLDKLSKRKGSKAEVLALLDALEVLLADASKWACGGRDELVNCDDEELVRRWSEALWPRGIETLALEMDLARQRMEVNVNPRLMLETVLARTARELR